jgi:hypothetical protein
MIGHYNRDTPSVRFINTIDTGDTVIDRDDDVG